jgi:hypothetical protein
LEKEIGPRGPPDNILGGNLSGTCENHNVYEDTPEL